MRPRPRRGAFGILALQAATDAPLAVIVAVVVAIAAFLVTAGPGALAQVADQELRHTLTGYSSARHDLTAEATFGAATRGATSPSDAEARFEAITSTVDGVVDGVIPPLAPVLGTSHWGVLTPRAFATLRADPDRPVALVVGLAATPDWRKFVTMVEGTAPTAWTGSDADPSGAAARTPVPVALSAASAKQMDVGVGDVLDVGARSIVVTGLYEPVDTDDALWGHLARLRDAAKGKTDDGRTAFTADALIDPGSTAGLQQTFYTARIQAWYPLSIDETTFHDVPRLAEQIRELSAGGVRLHSSEMLLFSPQLAFDLDAVTARVAVATALFALLVAGPLGVVLAVLALTAGAIAARRSGSLALARARGASGLQLRTAMLLEGAILAVPAAVVGALAAFAFTGGRTTLPGLWPAVLVAATPPLLLAIAVPGPAGRAGRSSARWVVEVLVAGLAAASVFLLFRRGVAPAGAGVDPLLAAAPLLIAAAVTIGVLRVYPWLMRAAQRSARRARGAVALVGSARSVRVPSLGFAAAFALIVGVSVAVFSAGMAATLARALVRTHPAVQSDAPPVDAGHPLVAAVFELLTAAAVIPLLFCIVAIVMAVIAAARSRNSTVGVLRVLGFSGAQVRGLVAWELVPVALVAIVAGVALGAVEVFVLSAAIDLSAFVGGAGAPPPRVDAAVTAGIAVVFAVATAVAAVCATAMARRRTPGSTIRMGME